MWLPSYMSSWATRGEECHSFTCVDPHHLLALTWLYHDKTSRNSGCMHISRFKTSARKWNDEQRWIQILTYIQFPHITQEITCFNDLVTHALSFVTYRRIGFLCREGRSITLWIFGLFRCHCVSLQTTQSERHEQHVPWGRAAPDLTWVATVAVQCCAQRTGRTGLHQLPTCHRPQNWVSGCSGPSGSLCEAVQFQPAALNRPR